MDFPALCLQSDGPPTGPGPLSPLCDSAHRLSWIVNTTSCWFLVGTEPLRVELRLKCLYCGLLLMYVCLSDDSNLVSPRRRLPTAAVTLARWKWPRRLAASCLWSEFTRRKPSWSTSSWGQTPTSARWSPSPRWVSEWVSESHSERGHAFYIAAAVLATKANILFSRPVVDFSWCLQNFINATVGKCAFQRVCVELIV